MRVLARGLVALLLCLPLAATAGTRAAVAAAPHFHSAAIADDTPRAELDRMHGDGLDTVLLTPHWYTDNPSSTNVHPTNATTPDPVLVQTLRTASAAGLRTILDPLLICTGCDGGWRGLVTPSDNDAFFASYRNFINHYADIAQQNGSSMVLIGSEMETTQSQTDQWRRVASDARSHFTGLLSYGLNWDQTVNGTLQFADAVDVVSVSAYYPLSNTDRPSVDELKAAWHSSTSTYPNAAGHDWVLTARRLSESTRRPVFFSEAGYRSVVHTANKPWDYTETDAPDVQPQANAYRALLDTFAAEPWWSGVSWWNWTSTASPSTDMGFTPRGKPAEQELARGRAPAPASPAPHPAPVSAPAPAPAPTPHATSPIPTPPVPNDAAAPAAPVPAVPPTPPTPAGRAGGMTAALAKSAPPASARRAAAPKADAPSPAAPEVIRPQPVEIKEPSSRVHRPGILALGFLLAPAGGLSAVAIRRRRLAGAMAQTRSQSFQIES